MNNKYFEEELIRVTNKDDGLSRKDVLDIMYNFCARFPTIEDSIVGFGGALTLKGLRSVTGDVDLSVDERHEKVLRESNLFEEVIEGGIDDEGEIKILRLGSLDIHLTPLVEIDSVSYGRCPFRVMTLESILDLKKKWKRDKDKEDIINIENELKRRDIETFDA